MAAPSNFNVSVSGSNATLTWTNGGVSSTSDPSCNPASKLNNRIERRPVGISTWSVIATVAAANTSYAMNSIPDGNWEVRVVSVESWWIFFSSCIQTTAEYPSTTQTIFIGGTTPNNFSFTNQTNRPINAWTTSNTVTISGLGTGINASVSLNNYTDRQWRKNGGSWQSSNGTVQNGDTLQLRMYPRTFQTTLSVNCTVGTLTRSWQITSELPGEVKILPSSGTISFDDIRGIWGPPPNVAVSLFDWRRNGPYWQSHSANNGVPTGNPLSLSDFYGCRGEWRITNFPTANIGDVSSSDAQYGPITSGSATVEWRWVIVSQNGEGLINAPALNNWSTNGLFVLSRVGVSICVINARLEGRALGSSTFVNCGNVGFTVGSGLQT